jgi:Putative MetA-pathway of phenol degradation
MLRKLHLAAAAAPLLFIHPGFGHHPAGVSGSGGAGPIYTISASTLGQGQSAASVFFEYTRLNELSDATLLNAALTGGHVHSLRTIETAALLYAYGVTNDLTVSARLPFVRRTDIREGHQHDPLDPPELHVRGDTAGIGDLILLGQYRFFNNKATRTEAAVLLGVKTPTGVTNRVDNQDERFETEFQPGSGSWDGIFGLAFTRRAGVSSFDTNVLYVLTGTGALDTNLGDRLLYNVALSYRLSGGAGDAVRPMKLGALPEPMYHGGPKAGGRAHSHQEPVAPASPALDVVLELNGERHDKQVEAGVKDPNSGGNTIYLSPGLRLSMDKWSGFVSVGIPVVRDLNGIQSEPDYRMTTGLSVPF